jgi:hypothetical protein
MTNVQDIDYYVVTTPPLERMRAGVVSAKVVSSDGLMSLDDVDITKWMAGVDAADLLALKHSNWSGETARRAIAWKGNRDPRMVSIFNHIMFHTNATENLRERYDVQVDPTEATVWLLRNRPEIGLQVLGLGQEAVEDWAATAQLRLTPAVMQGGAEAISAEVTKQYGRFMASQAIEAYKALMEETVEESDSPMMA